MFSLSFKNKQLLSNFLKTCLKSNESFLNKIKKKMLKFNFSLLTFTSVVKLVLKIRSKSFSKLNSFI